MAFYKKTFKKINNKWYPQSTLVGSPVTTAHIAKRLAAESTVAPADVRAVLESLSSVMGDYMAQGRSVKLDGIGSFYFQASATGNGVESAEKVSANQINGVKVVFRPETSYRKQGGKRLAIRALTDVDIEWIDVASLDPDTTINDEPGGEEPGGTEPQTVASPAISGTTPFATTTQVTITGPDGAEIRYTTDGSTPAAASTLYSAAFNLSATTTVKAIAIKDGVSSEVASKTFTQSTGGESD